jgi:CRP-like cAMP-binding protein
MNVHVATETAVDPRALDLVRRRLSAEVPLGPQDEELIQLACRPAASRPDGAELGLDGERLFLASGWACHVRELGDEGRQILGFILPGDLVGRADSQDPPAHRAIALTRVTLLDATLLEREARSRPGSAVAAALARADHREHARHLDHAVRLGALSAYRAMRHFLGDIHDRLAAVGLASEGRFDLPVAQDVLGDAMGISEVHANRVLAQMRREGLLELGPGSATLLSPAR